MANLASGFLPCRTGKYTPKRSRQNEQTSRYYWDCYTVLLLLTIDNLFCRPSRIQLGAFGRGWVQNEFYRFPRRRHGCFLMMMMMMVVIVWIVATTVCRDSSLVVCVVNEFCRCQKRRRLQSRMECHACHGEIVEWHDCGILCSTPLLVRFERGGNVIFCWRRVVPSRLFGCWLGERASQGSSSDTRDGENKVVITLSQSCGVFFCSSGFCVVHLWLVVIMKPDTSCDKKFHFCDRETFFLTPSYSLPFDFVFEIQMIRY